jgi:hypothetical protein
MSGCGFIYLVARKCSEDKELNPKHVCEGKIKVLEW